jgi:hypothetical protein
MVVTITNSPLVKVMGPLTAKLSVSPGTALAMACRSDPGPLSAVVVMVAAQPQSNGKIADTSTIKGTGLRMVRRRFLLVRAVKAKRSVSSASI